MSETLLNHLTEPPDKMISINDHGQESREPGGGKGTCNFESKPKCFPVQLWLGQEASSKCYLEGESEMKTKELRV